MLFVVVGQGISLSRWIVNKRGMIGISERQEIEGVNQGWKYQSHISRSQDLAIDSTTFSLVCLGIKILKSCISLSAFNITMLL
jgi:hypothetical protein